MGAFVLRTTILSSISVLAIRAKTIANINGNTPLLGKDIVGFNEAADALNVLVTSADGEAVANYNRVAGLITDDFDAVVTSLETGIPVVKPSLTISAPQSKSEGNSGPTLYTYTVTRNVTTGALAASWSFAAGTTVAADYTGGAFPTGGTLNFADGVATATFTVSVNGDINFETDEVFTVAIVANAAYDLGSPNSATGTILNDDAAPSDFINYGTLNPGQSTPIKEVAGRPLAGQALVMKAGAEQEFYIWLGVPTGATSYNGVKFIVHENGYIRMSGYRSVNGEKSISAISNITITPSVNSNVIIGAQIRYENKSMDIYEIVNGSKNILATFGSGEEAGFSRDMDYMFTGGNGVFVEVEPYGAGIEQVSAGKP